jgi:photosystem II stability/assembly factor-like uncharacterized protein
MDRFNSATLVAMRTMIVLGAMVLAAATAHSQWTLENSNSTASLRGIHSLGGGIAWASGTEGTVLRTEDGGFEWQTCSIPPGAEKLDFRGIQAFDANTAIVMSSGKGDLSRLYKTTDGCHSWKLVFTNPDKDGFWDAIKFMPGEKTRPFRVGTVYGDPVHGKFTRFISYDFGATWSSISEAPDAREGEAMFAASNSTLLFQNGNELIITGGSSGSRSRTEQYNFQHDPHVPYRFVGGDIPLAVSESAGAFSVATSLADNANLPASKEKWIGGVYGEPIVLVTVGGDYQKPDQSSGTAAFTVDGGKTWQASKQLPHGYRSAVAYDDDAKTWITVGPNGTDISTDDGKNWRAVKASSALNEPADADKNWNALSLPFVVGPHGRIGKLNEPALKAALSTK